MITIKYYFNNCETRIIPYVITWDGLVTKFHREYCKMLEIPAETEAYIQTITLKKTLELISLDRRRGIEEEDKEFEVGKSVESMTAAHVNVLE
ncbi:hypothetical protein COBT_002006 [Conglomerata obtusa]